MRLRGQRPGRGNVSPAARLVLQDETNSGKTVTAATEICGGNAGMICVLGIIKKNEKYLKPLRLRNRKIHRNAHRRYNLIALGCA